MNTQDWIDYFEQNKQRRNPPVPDFTGECALVDSEARRRLAGSLATFQLGESGEGNKLLGFAREIAQRELPGYDVAAAMFVREENVHAELLAGAVAYLGGELKSKQWTDGCFRRLRRLINLEFELQILLTAEIIGMGYYALMAEAVPDPAVRDLCRRLVSDEVGHLQFHAEFFRWRFRRKSPVAKAIWRAQFRAIFWAVRVVAWADHRAALSAYGVGAMQFFARTGRDRRWFERRLAPPGCPAGGVAVPSGSP